MTKWVKMAANTEHKQKTPFSSSSLLQTALLVLVPKPKIIERTYSTNVYQLNYTRIWTPSTVLWTSQKTILDCSGDLSVSSDI